MTIDMHVDWLYSQFYRAQKKPTENQELYFAEYMTNMLANGVPIIDARRLALQEALKIE